MNISIKAKIKSDTKPEKIFETILASRGLKTKKAQNDFLHPQEPTLSYILKESGIKKNILQNAKKLIDFHLKNNHNICIFGDYDADGVSATALMWQAITVYAKREKSSSVILPFIPDRHKHGYGLSNKAIEEVLLTSPKLVITVDTGIVAHEGIDIFKKNNIDTVITDHHQPLDSLPNANIIIHTISTSGAGVAWIFSMYLLGDPAIHLIDLATIGVVGDMMPLIGLNRSLCVAGLSALSHSKRPGIIALKNEMGIAKKDITTYDISFGIAPRINAAGRIYNPLDALRLLCTTKQDKANDLAHKIESHNKDRQEYTDLALNSIKKNTKLDKIIIILGDYHEGVIGLVAGKLVETYHKPAIVMCDNGDVIKGSARSLPGIDITHLLRKLNTPFLGLGGHEQAAGFSISKDLVSSMTKELENLADKEIKDELLQKSYFADLMMPLPQATIELAKMISTLEPFGIGNQKPKFYLEDLTVIEDRKLGSEGKHRKITVMQGTTTRELMLFNTKESYPLSAIKALICTIDINVWREKENLQLIGSYVET